MPPDRLIALTHCIRTAIVLGDTKEANVLLERRQSAIQEMVENDQRISIDELAAIHTADEMLFADLNERRSRALAALRQMKIAKRVRSAYYSF